MATASLNLYSRALNKDTCLEVLLPEKRLEWPEAKNGKKYPVLYLLHGHCQDQTAWLKSSRIEWYLRNQDLIVVCPDGDREFYVDGVFTHRYQTYLTEELPMKLKNWFPISERQKDTYIGGMSMGGYGSLNAALNHPGLYGGVIAMSPLIDPFKMDTSPEIQTKGAPPMDDEDSDTNKQAIFGGEENFYGSHYDNIACLEKFSEYQGEKPRIYLCCGRDDFLIEQSRDFAEKAAQYPGIDLTFKTEQGMHTWDFWDREIVTALKFFGLLPEDYERK